MTRNFENSQVGIGILVPKGKEGWKRLDVDGLHFEGVGRDLGGGGVQWGHVGALATATRSAVSHILPDT